MAHCSPALSLGELGLGVPIRGAISEPDMQNIAFLRHSAHQPARPVVIPTGLVLLPSLVYLMLSKHWEQIWTLFYRGAN